MVKSVLKFKVSLIGFLILTVTTSAGAAPICNSAEECQAVQDLVYIRLHQLNADPTPTLSDLVRDENGKLNIATQGGAVQYCRALGTRLPTARELGLFAMNSGAEGVTQSIDQNNKQDRAYVQFKTHEDDFKTTSNFYFSKRGYQRPSGDLDSPIWSASRENLIYSYYFEATNGEIRLIETNMGTALPFRCIVKQ